MQLSKLHVGWRYVCAPLKNVQLKKIWSFRNWGNMISESIWSTMNPYEHLIFTIYTRGSAALTPTPHYLIPKLGWSGEGGGGIAQLLASIQVRMSGWKTGVLTKLSSWILLRHQTGLCMGGDMAKWCKYCNPKILTGSTTSLWSELQGRVPMYLDFNCC